MDPVRKWVLIFGAFCVLLLAWYMAADRYTPYTTQARVNAFVVPIAPQVAGEILSVDVRTNQTVKKGDLLARIDPVRYELAVASAEAQLALTRQNLKVGARRSKRPRPRWTPRRPRSSRTRRTRLA